MGEAVGNEQCPQCASNGGDNSGDNLVIYADGGGHCFACGYHRHPDGGEQLPEDRSEGPGQRLVGRYTDLPKRGLDEADCRKWGVQVGDHPDKGPVHIFNTKYPDGRSYGQKYRTRDKKFSWQAPDNKHPIYGAWMWPSKGRAVVLTEGEYDAISVSKSQAHKYPVGSLPDGTGSVRKALAMHYDQLDAFDRIVLCFDQDEAGQAAVQEAIELLPPGKVYIMRLPEGCKDANQCLMEHGESALVKAFWDAAQWKPEGILAGEDMSLADIMQKTPAGVPMPYPKLQSMIYGFRPELTLLTAGSGIGKSTLAREWAYWLRVVHGCKVGNIFLEEPCFKTAQGFVAIDRNIPLGRLRYDPSLLTEEEWAESKAKAINGGMWFYNHFGSIEGKRLISKIAYMRRAHGIHQAVLDHISIMTSGLESSSEGERKDIDILMTGLQTVIQQTGVGIIAIVHLKRKTGVEFNEGGQISLSDLRGSGSLEQLSDNVIGLERDQQAAGERACLERIRVLKCRETGYTGLADTLRYDRPTGRLVLANDFKPSTSEEEEHKF